MWVIYYGMAPRLGYNQKPSTAAKLGYTGYDKTGYSKKNSSERFETTRDKYNSVKNIGEQVLKLQELGKKKGKYTGNIVKGYNKYLGAASGAALGYVLGDVPGSLAGSAVGYQVGKRVDDQE